MQTKDSEVHKILADLGYLDERPLTDVEEEQLKRAINPAYDNDMKLLDLLNQGTGQWQEQ